MKIKGSGVEFSGSFEGGGIHVYDHKRNLFFIKGYRDEGEIKNYQDIEKWISNCIARLPQDYFEWLNDQLSIKHYMKYLLPTVFIISCSCNNWQSSLPKDHYVVLPFDKDANTTLAKNSIPASLNDSDFVIIDYVLSVCIDIYSQEQTAEYKKMIKKFPGNSFLIGFFQKHLKNKNSCRSAYFHWIR